MKGQKDILLDRLRGGEPVSRSQQMKLTLLLSLPAILAQSASVLMQYIDAGMVGRLGANPSASIGLIITSTWIMSGFTEPAISRMPGSFSGRGCPLSFSWAFSLPWWE